jgi:acetylornithine deacetylase/succinyl-diaminopimelate desuccinylase-like protein
LDFLEACRKIISIDSSPHNGTAEVALFAAELCKQQGLFVDLQEGVLNGLRQINVIARPFEQRPGDELMLQTHLDTVDPGSYGLWTETDKNPFNATIKAGKIYGLGVADVKLDFICKLFALKNISNEKLKSPYVLVGTYGEETGMWGAKNLLLEKKVSAKRALLGEPSEMKIIYASNGLAVINIKIPFSIEERNHRQDHQSGEGTSSHSKIFRGKAAHSSTPALGENAISKLVQYLDQLPEGLAILTVDGGISHNTVPDQAMLEVELGRSFKESVARKFIRIFREMENISTEFMKFPSPDFDPNCPTMNIGLVRTNEDGVEMTASIRITPSVTREVMTGWLNRLQKFCASLNCEARLADYKSPSLTSLQSPLVKSCFEQIKDLGRMPMVATKSASNESSIYSLRGIECVVLGPGRSIGNSHCPNEQNTIEELEFAIRFYQGIVERLCA